MVHAHTGGLLAGGLTSAEYINPKWGSLESTRPGRGAFEGHHMGIRCPCGFSPIFLGPMSIGIDLNSFERKNDRRSGENLSILAQR